MSAQPEANEVHQAVPGLTYVVADGSITITVPPGTYAIVGKSQMATSFSVPAHRLGDFFVRANDTPRSDPQRRRTVVWFYRTERQIILPLSIANYDQLMAKIADLSHPETAGIIKAVQSAASDYHKAPPP